VSYSIPSYKSKLILYEDGKPLGPVTDIHKDIREKGNGRYSHWGKDIYFSASDNSNPNTNNKKYMIKYPVVIPPSTVLIFVALILLIILIPVTKKTDITKIALLKIIFIIGLSLSGLNITNLFMSLRNPDLLTIMDRKDDITLDYRKALEQIPRRPGESDKAYVFRVNDIVNKSMANIKIPQIQKYKLMRVSIWENYALYIYNLIYSDKHEMYHYFDYKKALERGVGLCSQQAMVVTAILNENGIEAEMVGLSEHIVLRAKVDESTWYTVDPDYGVVIPYDIPEIESSPEVIVPYYKNIKSNLSGDESNAINLLVKLYAKEGKEVFQKGIIGYKGERRHRMERLSYKAVWIIPLILCLPYLLAISLLRIRNIIQRHTNR
jgi:hypothetical protein